MTTVERLHYYNGQRLDAADLGLEQHYHLAMRRLLNRGLFTPGVVDGLEVDQPAPADTTHVLVAPGLALDALGRELVVPEASLEDRALAVPAQPPVKQGGYFLVLRYTEEFLPAADDPCARPAAPQSARVRERAEFVWTEDYPAQDLASADKDGTDSAVVLAYVTLDDQCRVTSIETGIRQYARPTHTTQVTGFALEGEKDIAPGNSKVLHFEIRGGAPNAVVLYLWGGKFSDLYYTQLGGHQHTLTQGNIPLSPETIKLVDHRHRLTDHTHRPEGSTPATEDTDLTHGHGLLTELEGLGGTFGRTPIPLAEIPTRERRWDQLEYHRQSRHENGQKDLMAPWIEPVKQKPLGGPVKADGSAVPAETEGMSQSLADAVHSHTLTADLNVSSTGSPNRQAASEPAYAFLSDLKIKIDTKPVTDKVLRFLRWPQLGDGGSQSDLVLKGTEALDLIDIANSAGLPMDAGPHTLEFYVDNDSGGKLLYNLYVE
ncbi:hypothetical protein [Streptomyces flaveus]|uniref:Uncharacterized protein n=1 Tax=Streptomyces flaveus TaxID=66370 RepID=A0A917VQJ5_9ACTN|nr:hypothetical protein [Streptomyces flaveus]GGL04241.1 hypothetical protein GCM10010094_76280 [Streptomyces flaveus]